MSIEIGDRDVYSVQTRELELLPAHHRDNESNVVRAAWPVHRGTGSRGTAAVYFELERGTRLGRHTDSAEEVLVVLAGEVDLVVGDERRRLTTGGIAVVPAEVPHDVVGVGDGVARVAGVFPSETVVSVFDDEWVPYGTRVLGTPPAEAVAAAGGAAS
jgi:quercetin dioxygenase-like cupin family protein